MIEKKYIDGIRWASSLSDKFKSKLVAIAQHKTIASTDHVSLQKLSSSGVSYIIKGTAVVTMQTPSLKTINSMVFGPGDWFGDYQSQKDSILSFKFSLVGTIDIITFDNEKLQHLIHEDMETFRWLYYISYESKPKWLQSQLLSSEKKEVKIVYLLLELAVHQLRNSASNTNLYISQQALSEMIGISRQRVNEVLINLQLMHYISLERNCINLLNLNGLGYLLNEVDLSIRDPRILLLDV